MDNVLAHREVGSKANFCIQYAGSESKYGSPTGVAGRSATVHLTKFSHLRQEGQSVSVCAYVWICARVCACVWVCVWGYVHVCGYVGGLYVCVYVWGGMCGGQGLCIVILCIPVFISSGNSSCLST